MLRRIALLAIWLPWCAFAGLLRFEITERSPVLEGKAFGTAGAYERIVGRAYFAVDPDAPANRLIVNLKKAPRNAAGRTARNTSTISSEQLWHCRSMPPNIAISSAAAHAAIKPSRVPEPDAARRSKDVGATCN